MALGKAVLKVGPMTKSPELRIVQAPPNSGEPHRLIEAEDTQQVFTQSFTVQ